ncbi:MAG: ferrous iron transport protein A [Rhodospirillaceae bacterium]|nr:ferrous iron transport protein A [Rhodospirillaceae bacterium]
MTQVSLTQAPIGQSLRIVGIDGGRAIRLRLATMGLREGGEIRLSHAASAGPVVVEIGGGRLVLGTGMAEKILVSAVAVATRRKEECKNDIGAAGHGRRRFRAGFGLS